MKNYFNRLLEEIKTEPKWYVTISLTMMAILLYLLGTQLYYIIKDTFI
jgi:hypothetical protein